MKSYIYTHKNEVPGFNFTLNINGIDIMSSNCTNNHIRKCFLNLKKISPRGKFFWNSHFTDVNWHRAWLVPFRYCITNKVRELHLKILHNIGYILQTCYLISHMYYFLEKVLKMTMKFNLNHRLNKL